MAEKYLIILEDAEGHLIVPRKKDGRFLSDDKANVRSFLGSLQIRGTFASVGIFKVEEMKMGFDGKGNVVLAE